MGWFASFLYSQIFVTLPKPTADFTSQTIIITGSNTGLGLEAARHLSQLNTSLLILAVRDPAKGATAKASILASTGRSPSSIEVWPLDMQSPSSISTFCARAATLPRVDAVLENAGIMTKHFTLAAGYESTITTNVIGTFLLAVGMLPKLRASAAEHQTQGRLSVVGSDIHFIAKFPEGQSKDIFEALNAETTEMGMERYAVSKLLSLFAVRELASQSTPPPSSKTPSVIINTMTPGACKSDFDRESTGVARLMAKLMYAMIARTTEEGSRALIAAVAGGRETNGKYMADCKIAEPGPLVIGKDGMALQKKVWSQLVDQLERIQPGISKNI